MEITSQLTDAAIMAELGRRLEVARLERNLSQAQIAAEAGVSKRTVERIEAGESVKLASFIRVLRVLGLAEGLERGVPEPLPSPIEQLKLRGKRRRRASNAPPRPGGAAPGPWAWGDGS